MWTRLPDNGTDPHRRRRKAIAGITVVEMIVVCALACTVILTSSAMLSQSIDTWSESTSQTFSDDDCSIAMQRIQRDLQAALSIEIASDGQSITYTLPARDPGDPHSYLLPPQPERDAWGNIIYHSFYRDGEELLSSDADRPILRRCPLLDPDLGSAYYLFAMVSGTVDVVRVHLVSEATNGEATKTTRLVQEVQCRSLQL
jgi:hypothetical protein